MADSQGTPTPTGPGDKKDLSMELRLLIAFLLMGLVLFLTQYLYKPPATPVQHSANPKPAEAAKAPAPVPAESAPAPASVPGKAVAGQVAAASEQIYTIDTDLYEIRFSNLGAVVHSWTLKKYRDRNNKPLELVNAEAAPKAGWPFSLELKDQKPTSDPDKALFKATPDPDALGIAFDFSDGRSEFHKSFRFAKNSYLWQIASSAKINGTPAPNLLFWRGGFGDQTIPNAATVEHAVYYDLSASKLVVKSAKDAKNGPVSDGGNFSFAGIEDTYFAAVLLPHLEGRTELDTFSDTLPNPATKKDEARVGTAAGGSADNRYEAYVGPKDVDILNAVDPRLKQLIDWGWFGVIAKPLFYCLKWIDGHISHSYGWSIILLTVTINLLLLAAALHQPEIVAQDAGAAAPHQSHQRQVQEHLHARSAQGGAEPGSDGSLQEARRESGWRMPAHAAAATHPVRHLPGSDRRHRAARRALAVGDRSFPAREPAHPHPALSDGGDAVPAAADDAEPNHRSLAAENDDVHAAGVRLLFLLLPERPCIILVNRQSGGHSAAMGY